MNSGYFFSLDAEKSRQEDNLAVFHYTDLPAYLGAPDKDTPKYPISVVITSDSVKFMLHYCAYKITHTYIRTETKDDNKGEKECTESYFLHYWPKTFQQTPAPGEEIKKIIKTDVEISHIEEEIFELPFASDSKRLTSTVKKLYSTIFPLTITKEDNSSNYMAYLIKARYENESCGLIDKENLTGGCQKERQLDAHRECYSSLFIWKLKNSKKLFSLSSNQGTKQIDKFLRKLLLDFLFDVKHGEVFKNSGNYRLMLEGFENNFFLSSILKKSEFYYQNKIASDMLVSEKEIQENSNKDKSKNEKDKPENKKETQANTTKKAGPDYCIYEEYLDKAERDWVECIKSPEAAKHFYYIPNWYDAEAAKVNKESWWRKMWQKIITEFKVSDDTWFVEPEEEMQRIIFNIPRKLEDKTVKTDSVYNSYEFARKNKKGWNRLKRMKNLEELADREKQISKWFFKRYDFADALRLAFMPGANFLLLVILTFVAIAFIFYPETISTYSKEIFWAACIFAGTWLIIKLFKPESFHIHFLFPRLISSIAAAWLTITMSEDMFKVFFDMELTWISPVVICTILLIFIIYEVNKIIPYSSLIIRVGRALELMLISFVISILVGIFAINFTGEKLLERCGILPEFYSENFSKKNDFYYVSDAESGKYELEKIDTTKNKALCESCKSIAINHEFQWVEHMDKVYYKSDKLPLVTKDLIAGDYKIFILWDFLIQFAFVAMFIGIFIQMIFEEKNITES